MASRLSIRRLYEESRESGRPLIGGHRGNPAEQPENTLASFRSALNLGVDMIECDVHMSSDGHLVVIHDPTVDRTTNGTGPVRNKTLDELRALDAGRGERIPIIQEVLDLALGRAGICIELKQYPVPYEGLEQKLVDILRERRAVDATAVISFYHPTVKTLKQLEPGLAGGVLIQPGVKPDDPVELLEAASAEIYSPNWSDMTPDLVQTVHASNGVVGVWTVDDQAAIDWCKICRPDSIFTNRPAEVGPAFK